MVVGGGLVEGEEWYGGVGEGRGRWEVKGGSEEKYVSGRRNKERMERNGKMENLEEDEGVGMGMGICGMSVVFRGVMLV